SPTPPAAGSLQQLLHLAHGRSATGPAELLVSPLVLASPVESVAAEPSTVLPDSTGHAVAVVPADRTEAIRLLAVTRPASLMATDEHQPVITIAPARPLPWLLVA